MTENKELIKHVSLEELKKLTRKEKNKYIYERLLFIHQLYLNDSVTEACERMCISEQTGYNWLDLWNKNGYDGLVPDPDSGRGRPPKMTEEQKEQLKENLKSKVNWLTSEIRALIKQEFDVIYSYRQVIRILRDFNMHYAKPYAEDYRKPNNSEQILKQTILDELGDIPQDAVVGFFDEASPQTTDNRQRFWSFGKPKIIKNTAKYKANTFGFYPINGKEVVEFMGNSKAPSVCEFMRYVSDRNSCRPIVAFADNARSHVAGHTKRFAAQHNIRLVFIPKYSPNLNPIEFIWKSIRRIISRLLFIKSEWSFRETIRTAFCRLAKKKSFMAGWLEKFGPSISNLLCQ